MTIPRPHDRPISTHAAADGAIETFTVRLPRWPIFRLLSRNPLIRVSDRIEALVLALAVAVSLLAAPIAAAVGTAVHDSRRDVYAEQAHTRHVTTATVTDDSGAQKISRTNTVNVLARWSAAGTEHTGEVTAHSPVKTGDHVAIWIDHNGALTDEPTPTTRAAVDAVTAAVAMWAGVAAVAAVLVAGTRNACDRFRVVGWQHDIDLLVGRGGHTNTSR